MTIEIRRRESGAVRDWPAVHPVLARVYRARGIETPEELILDLDRLLPVGSLEGVQEAAELLLAHREQGRVLIVGDFDADGATSTALMVRALRGFGFSHVDFMVPDRFRFGYGLTPAIVRAAIERRPSLIVTVDNGVASLEGVALARASGVAVLVTDHHLPGRELPAASVIVNPNLPASGFPSRYLAGVGVAFYVMAALSRRLPGVFNPATLLDLVALGTVADLVPLDRNNRVLVHQGLARIRAGRCVPGIRALFEAAGRRIATAGTADLGFAVAPRLNAAGRLTDMRLGIDCLLANSPQAAAPLARQLSELNAQRRDIEARMQEEAVRIATDLLARDAGGSPAAALCLFDPDWHPGVVGLVAGRLKDRLHRPVIAFAPAEADALRGSARSVEGVHIRDVLDAVATAHPGLLDKFGGHAMAAGLTLPAARLEDFRAAFDATVRRHRGADALRPVRYSDGELEATHLALDTARALRAGGPWGQGFAEPQFDGEFELLDSRLVGERHLKMRLRAGGGAELAAIHFGYLGSEFDDARVRAGARVRLLYRLEVNEYEGVERVQLNSSCLVAL
ncbi:MAG: single-stranded-DNA-specific exonuclease RecJ [Proteobacteria bacterium]|nr:single-stranded-DNA-specific exonuclease RecJ [Pseudomonadota bacterium]